MNIKRPPESFGSASAPESRPFQSAFSCKSSPRRSVHYDLPHATGVEGYSGLVVHGPLIATLLLDGLRRHRRDATVRAFAFRAVRPLICGQPFTVNGRAASDGTLSLWATDAEGRLAMQANAELA